MTERTDDLRRFLLDVQSNLEKTLTSVTQKLHDLTETPLDEIESVTDGPSASFETDPFASVERPRNDSIMPPIMQHAATSDVIFAPVSDITLAPPKGAVRVWEDTSSVFRKSERGYFEENLFSYSFKEHKQENLSKNLERLRNLKEMPQDIWESQIRIKDAQGYDIPMKGLDALAADQFPCTIHWQWLGKPDIVKFSYLRAAKFYWLGLTRNYQLKAAYMQFHAKLRVLSQKAQALTVDWIEDSEWLKEEQRKIQRNRSSRRLVVKQDYESEILLAKDTLRLLEALLLYRFQEGQYVSLRGDEFLQMAGCPLDELAAAYLADRDGALNIKSRDVRRRELVKAVVKGVDGFECLCQSLHQRIVENDNLIFKLLLLIINCLTCIAQFIYADHIKEKPLWVKQIDAIHGTVLKDDQ